MSLNTILRVVNYRTGATIAETSHVIAYAYESALNACNAFSYTVRANDPVAEAIVACVGGADGRGPYLPYKIGLSHDGGATFDVWKLVDNVERGLYVSDSGASIFRAYSVSGEDHVTYHGCTLDEMLYGRAGTIPMNGADSGLVASTVAFRWVKGLFQTHPIASTAYTPVIYPYLRGVRFDADVVADYLDSALKTILTHVSGLALPGDSAPLGFRGNFVEDSSDANLNLAGVTRSLAIGFVGMEPFLQFRASQDTSNPFYIPLHEDRGSPITLRDDRTTLLAKVRIDGGATNCGLPSGGNILDPVCINTKHASSALAWDASLCVFACADSAGNGGVFYWAHDGIAYPIGQAIAARALVYYAPLQRLYAATDNGVMWHTADVYDSSPWRVLGGLRAKCTKLVVGETGVGSEPRLVVQVTGNGSGDGLYLYPPVASDTSGATHGYDGWSLLTTGSVSTWTYHSAGDALLSVDSNDPTAVTFTYYASDPAHVVKVRTPTPFGEGVIALAGLPSTYGTAVMTSLGADALYRLGLDGIWHDLNRDTTLLDANLNPVLVNNVVYYGGPLVLGNRTLTVYWFALTDGGVFYSTSFDGGDWQPPDTQSGIVSENIVTLAIGAPQTLIDRVINRLYACSSNGFWVSNNSGANFRNELREKLTLGPFFTALGRLVGQSPFLANDVTSLGPIPAGGSTGTSGRNIASNFPAPYTLSGDLVWVRALSQRNTWEYRLVHATSVAPYQAISFGTVGEASTDGDMGAATASGHLAALHVRYLADRSRVQRTMELRAYLTDYRQRLRALRATHLITLAYDTTPVYAIQASDMRFYVLKVSVSKGANDLYPLVTTSVSSVLRSAPLTLQEIVEGIGFTLNRMQHTKA